MRQFAISDIHGCVKTFKALLEKIEFTTEDELYLLGDYIDRGPDSKGVIDYIWLLQKEGYVVHCLKGNHEQMLVDERKRVSISNRGQKATLRSFEVLHQIHIPEQYIEWMDKLPYYFEVGHYILVHAGLSFTSGDPLTEFTEMIWIRNWYGDLDKEWLAERIIVHGHTPTKKSTILNNFKIIKDLPVVNIDNGCVFKYAEKGNLIAMDLTNQELYFHANVDEE